MLKGTGISPLGSVSVAVAALILGKAVLIADMLPMINRFPNKPLIYNVAWKTLIYLLVATLIHYGAPCRFLAASWRPCGRQRKIVGGNRVAAFLGHPDHSARADCHVLHDARTGARDWEGKGAADILRPDAYPASLSEALTAEAKKKYLASPREAYRAIGRPSARFDAPANSLPVLRSLIKNVLFSPSVDHGPGDTSLNSTKRQSVTSVSFNPR